MTAPAGLAVAGNIDSVTVTWNAYTGIDITGYQYRYDLGGGYIGWTDATPAQAAARAITVAGLLPDSTITIQVRALAGGEIGPAGTITAVTPSLILPTLTPTPTPTPRPPIVESLGDLVIDIGQGSGDRASDYGFASGSDKFGVLVSGQIPGKFFTDNLARTPTEVIEDSNGWLVFAVADTPAYQWADAETLQDVSLTFAPLAPSDPPGSGYTLHSRLSYSDSEGRLIIWQPWGFRIWSNHAGARETINFGLRKPHLYAEVGTGSPVKEPVARPGSFWEWAQENTPGGPVTFQLMVSVGVTLALLVAMMIKQVAGIVKGRQSFNQHGLRNGLFLAVASLICTPWIMAAFQQGSYIASGLITLLIVAGWLGWRQLQRTA